jgi:Ca2+-binding RTX toxin-like protein
MWPGTRRICANVADARLSAAVIETLEQRRLLTAAAGDGALPTEWGFVGADGESRGTATLVDGILHVVTTSGGDAIQLGTNSDADLMYVTVVSSSGSAGDYSRVLGVQVERSRVHGIQIDAGDGNDTVDYHNFGGLLNLPTTINGGAGDDGLMGELDRNFHDDPIAFRNRQHSYAGVVLNGGDGNDYLDARIGDTTLIGGAGDDQFVTADSWGHNTIIDDPPPAPPAKKPLVVPPAPMDTQPVVKTTAPSHVNAPADAPITPRALSIIPFSTQPLTAANGPAVLGEPADALWDVLH